MAVCIFSRKGIHVKQGKGEIAALLVPSHDQIAVYRDTSMSAADVAQRSGNPGKVPLWREVSGTTVLYGILPDELRQDRHAMRVWLASDFAPSDAEAFFYLFEKRWLIHGIRQTDDEGRQTWRTTVIQHDPETIFQVVADHTADLMLSGTIRNVTVAVDGDLNAYSQLRELLEPLQLSPVPFSILKPSARTKMLYRQRDYTLLMMVSVFFLVLAVSASVGWWVLNSLKLSKLESQIATVRQQISSIQLNDNLGQVEDPSAILTIMKAAFVQQPSAIMDAAAKLGAAMGQLKSLDFPITPQGGGSQSYGSSPAETVQLPPDQRALTATLSSTRQKLLVNQEQMAKNLLPQLPWVREVASVGGSGQDTALRIVLQVDPPADGTVLPSPTAVVDMDALTSASTITEDPSATAEVSSSALVAAPAVASATAVPGALPQPGVPVSPTVANVSRTIPGGPR